MIRLLALPHDRIIFNSFDFGRHYNYKYIGMRHAISNDLFRKVWSFIHYNYRWHDSFRRLDTTLGKFTIYCLEQS